MGLLMLHRGSSLMGPDEGGEREKEREREGEVESWGLGVKSLQRFFWNCFEICII